MYRWIDVRTHVPPQGMNVLLYIRQRYEDNFFEDGFVNGYARHPEIEKDEYIDHRTIGWGLISRDFKTGCKKRTILDPLVSDENTYQQIEVTYWSLLPPLVSGLWVDFAKFPPPSIEPLVCFRNSFESCEDVIGTLQSVTDTNCRSEIYEREKLEPVLWTMKPNLPKMIDDGFM